MGLRDWSGRDYLFSLVYSVLWLILLVKLKLMLKSFHFICPFSFLSFMLHSHIDEIKDLAFLCVMLNFLCTNADNSIVSPWHSI